MKRYRVFLFDLNSTGTLVDLEIKEEWEESVKANHLENQRRMIEGLIQQYGEREFDQKLDNLRAIGGQAFSVIAYHNRFYRQARDAFIIGAYYPALTAACALGERILNHLILGLRDDYKEKLGHAEFATVKSSSNWRRMIPALEAWGVLLPAVAIEFWALLEMRNRAIHFNPKTADLDREMAADALKHLDEIISVQFGAFRCQPWFIPDTRGVQFIKKDWEADPFVRVVYLPVSLPVGPNHWMDYNEGEWTIHDDDYEEREVSDEEYVRLHEFSVQQRLEQLRP